MSEGQTYVALLRGINVGGKHKLPMKELAAIFSECKCAEVRTFIQSGNVVFSASPEVVKQLPAIIGRKIEERFGFPAPTILRDCQELTKAIRDNPFAKQGLPESALHLYFLAKLPTSAAVKSLDPNRSAPDEFRVIGRHIYLHLPNGMARTKLTTAYFDSRLATVCTARNWATVNKLWQLLAG